MYTIKENNTYELEIKKSKFITKLYKVHDTGEVVSILSSLREEYSDATHHCYAYIINEHKKSSDDGEPGGTAGIPILQVLDKNDLNYVLCVVIRYFGGIKLGAGGLVRAYTKSISELIKETKTVKLIKGYKIEIEIPYEEQKQLDYIIRELKYHKSYDSKVTYQVLIPKENVNKLQEYNPTIIEEIEIEKELSN